MKVLVSGASGFLGRYVVDQLLKRGHGVRAIIRPAAAEPTWAGEVEIFRADLRVHDHLERAFDGVDAVIHLAAATSGDEDSQFASTVVATERFLDAMVHSSVKRLVHVSSLVAYDWSRVRSMMDEESPLVTDIYGMGGYTIAKVWQERVVFKLAKAHSWDLTVMRPGFIWGPEHTKIAGMGRQFGRVHVMFGPYVRLPLTYVANCADCIVAVLERPAAVGETFNVVDSDQIRVWRYVREYVRQRGERAYLLPVPYYLGFGVALFASVTSRILFGKKGKLPSLLVPRRFESQFKPVRFSTRKLKEKLAWSPPLAFDQCLDLTYK
jgi:UDP-glucose 4-epimerase